MLPWIHAWRLAATSFYEAQQPSDHFRTCVQESDVVAEALAQLAIDVARDLESSGEFSPSATLDVVDVGGGSGELLVAVMSALERREPALARRCRPVVVELRTRPLDLPPSIEWIVGAAPEAVPTGIAGLLIAHELLDDVPLDIAICDESGTLRTMLVDPETGHESLGNEASPDMLAWSADWWPVADAGERVEIGSTRDAMWCALTSRINHGIGVAIDYAHSREQRAAHRWSSGSIAGYQRGQEVPPIPHGAMNITAHVALDSCADAAAQAARSRGVDTEFTLLAQRDALDWITANAPSATSTAQAGDITPHERLVALARHSHVREARNPQGFGAFTWLVQSMGAAIPSPLASGSITT